MNDAVVNQIAQRGIESVIGERMAPRAAAGERRVFRATVAAPEDAAQTPDPRRPNTSAHTKAKQTNRSIIHYLERQSNRSRQTPTPDATTCNESQLKTPPIPPAVERNRKVSIQNCSTEKAARRMKPR